MVKNEKDPQKIRIQVVFLRTFKERLTEKYDKELTQAVEDAKTKFPMFAPQIEELQKKCRQEDAASLAIVLTGELKYGMENETAMRDCLNNAKAIIDDWITLSNLVKNSGSK